MTDKAEIFHVHTWRCGHAEKISDEAYILRAIDMGADRITFTDHAPFPGNPFGNRMRMDQLEEYITALQLLKEKYKRNIDIQIGLEVEFLPSYYSYIEELSGNDEIEFLLLGQHFCEIEKGVWSFQMENKSNEWRYLLETEMEAMTTGLFDAVAHPDRAFRRCRAWNDEMADIAEEFIAYAAHSHYILLEKNISSLRQNRYFWKEFWNMLPLNYPTIIGCDAHTLNELMISTLDDF